jgi:hypothetical protein
MDFYAIFGKKSPLLPNSYRDPQGGKIRIKEIMNKNKFENEA